MILQYLYEHFAILAISFTSVFAWAFLRWRQDRNYKLPPGPNGWPIIGNVPAIVCSNPTDYFTECSKKFGDIFKLQFGQLRVCIVSNTDLVREVFNDKNAQDRVPNIAYYKAFGRNAHGIAFSSKGPWKESRKFVLGLFRDLGVGRGIFESKVISEAERLILKFREGVDQTEVNLKQKFFWAVGNITCGIVFGKQYEYDDPTLKQLINFVDIFPKVCGPAAIFLTSPLLCALPFGPGSNAVNCLSKFKQQIKEIINERISSFDPKGTPSNVVDAFLYEVHQKEGNSGHINHDNLLACFVDLFAAATETTTSTLSFAILFLASYLPVQEKCQKELDLFIKEGGKFTYSERSKLPYFQAVIHETLRMSIVGPLEIPHVTDKDIKLSGFDLPKGTTVAMNLKAIVMNEDIFENPKEFNPERFIKDGVFEESPHVIPFSIGSRVCLGERLARMELFIFLSHLLFRYTFKPPKDVTMPSVWNGVEFSLTRCPLPYSVVISERFP